MNAEQHEQMIRCFAAHLETTHSAKSTRVTTHISSIVLCGDRAYKFKRPVALPFVDFSTLEKRHFFCLEELRLNQRTAPDIYLAVEPVCGSIEQPRLNETGQVLDYAVVMKRFRTADLLSERLTNGLIDVTDIDLLAQHLGQFAERSEPIDASQLGGTKKAIDWALESLVEINNSPMHEKAIDWQAVNEHTTQLYQTLKTLDQTRQSQGYFRECHADLHLANLVRLGDRVLAFDALEFEPALRMIDLISDVAFPFMDLLAHQHEALAWRFISQWCEHTGDYEALKLLPFYSTYRAIVRAKVSILSDDTSGFERYWQLVRQLCDQTEVALMPRQNPRIVLVSGLSGSGKSTVALRIAGTLGGVRLRADAERKRLFPSQLNNPESLYSDQASTQTYARLIELTKKLHGEGLHVVVDATFLTPERVKEFVSAFAENSRDGVNDGTCVVIRCQAPVKTLESRIQTRQEIGSDPSDATVSVLAKQLKDVERRVAMPGGEWPYETHDLINDGSMSALELKTDQLVAKFLESS